MLEVLAGRSHSEGLPTGEQVAAEPGKRSVASLEGQRAQGAELHWNEEANKAFDKLKELLTSAPVLGYPSPEGEFVLDTDASGHGLGAVLAQLHKEQEIVIKANRPVGLGRVIL